MRWESELIPIISNSKKELGRYNKVATEVSSGYGVADLVFFDFNQAVVDERVRQGLSPIEHINLLRILLELQKYRQNQSVSITTLRKKTPSLRKDLVTFLIDNNFLIAERNNTGVSSYRKGFNYQNGLQEVVAIEAKLKNWRRGLYQAYRYRCYADKSYLAVYTKAINAPLRHRQEFKKFNVGLIEVVNDNIKVHIEPQKEKHTNSFIKALAYENLLASQENLFPHVKKIPSLITI